jgi:FMN phosphatase YigB (HAD superfamily)
MIDAVIFDWGGTLTPWKTMDFRAGWRTYATPNAPPLRPPPSPRRTPAAGPP